MPKICHFWKANWDY